MGRAQFASFFLLEVAATARSPSFFESAASTCTPRSPMSPFSAVAPSRFICVSRPQAPTTLDTIAEEDAGSGADLAECLAASLQAASPPRFF